MKILLDVRRMNHTINKDTFNGIRSLNRMCWGTSKGREGKWDTNTCTKCKDFEQPFVTRLQALQHKCYEITRTQSRRSSHRHDHSSHKYDVWWFRGLSTYFSHFILFLFYYWGGVVAEILGMEAADGSTVSSQMTQQWIRSVSGVTLGGKKNDFRF